MLEAKPILLLVEDEKLLSIDLEDELIAAGFDVFAARNGTAAIAEIANTPGRFTALITDIRLGTVTDGWSVALHARANNPDIAVVYVSGHAYDDWASRGVPGSIMLRKPLAPGAIMAALTRLMIERLPTEDQVR